MQCNEIRGKKKMRIWRNSTAKELAPVTKKGKEGNMKPPLPIGILLQVEAVGQGFMQYISSHGIVVSTCADGELISTPYAFLMER